MGKHDIGDYFKNRIKGHNKDINTDDIWANLNLDEKKKKRRAIWWLWPMGIGLLLVIPSIYFINQNLNEKNYYSEAPALENKIEIDDENIIQVNNGNETNNQKEQESSTQSTTLNNSSTQKPLNKPDTKAKAATEQVRLTSDLKRANQNQTDKSLIRTDLIKEEFATESLSSNNLSNATSTINIKNKSVDGPLQKSTKFLQKSNHPKRLILTLNQLRLQDLVKINYKDRSMPSIASNFILPKSPWIKREVKNKKGRFTIDLYTGAFAVNRSISNKEIVIPILEKKIMDETPLEMLAFGSQLQYKWPNNFYVTAGLEFQSINEKYKHQQSTIIDTITKENVPTVYQVSADRDTSVYMMGNGQFAVSLDENFTFYNNHKLFTIPLSIGYTLQKKKWSYSLETTFLPTIYNQFTGTTVDLDGSLSPNPSYLSTTMKLGYRLSASIERNVGENLGLYFKPSYQGYSSSFAEGFSQKYSFAGGVIGLRYGF